MMRKLDGKTYRDMTPAEIAERESQFRLDAIAERSRPLTVEEVSRMIIYQQVNSLMVDDNTALRMKDFYPHWAEGVTYGIGFKVLRNGKLWRCLKAHTSQSGWEPENAASLWEQINETREGTIDDPIPYSGNMVLEKDKYYIQDSTIYLCKQSTGNPVYHPLAQLVDIYVEII